MLAAFFGALIVRAVGEVLSETLGYYWPLALGALFLASVIVFPRGGWVTCSLGHCPDG